MESDREDNLSEWSDDNGGDSRTKLMQSSLKKKPEDRPAGFSKAIKRGFFNR